MNSRLEKIKTYLNIRTAYVISSFLAGFSLMTIELTSARIVAPILGNSVFTWTSVIGTTLLGLTVGSYIGGKIADKKTDPDDHSTISTVIIVSAIAVSLIPMLVGTTKYLLQISDSIVLLNIIISIYLFLLPASMIGMIQPIILKLYANNFSNLGAQYGRLSALWSTGSILGVFLTGFLFTSYIGSKETIWIISLLLYLIGAIFSYKDRKKLAMLIGIPMAALALIYGLYHFSEKNRPTATAAQAIFDQETDYYRARVFDRHIPGFGDSRLLTLDFDTHSIDPETPNEYFYPEIYPVFSFLMPQDNHKNADSMLVIGAGAYTLPKYLKKYYPDSTVQVIENDPALVDIGKRYFGLDTSQIATKIGDARLTLPKINQKYDLIFGDAYNSFISVPWYLLTKEWNDTVKDKLGENGVYAVNFIGSLNGPGKEFSHDVIGTFRKTFKNYYVFYFADASTDIGNIIVIGINGDAPLSESALKAKLEGSAYRSLSQRLIPKDSIDLNDSIVLTDDFSPDEHLMQPIMEKYFPLNLYFNDFLNIEL
jgi:spermidine synthase